MRQLPNSEKNGGAADETADSKSKVSVWVCALLLFALGLLTAGCKAEPAKKADVVRLVYAQRVADVSGLVKRSFPGRAKAENEVNSSFRISGPLITRSGNVGDQVKKGDVLARIDPRDYEVILRNTQAQLERGKAELGALRQARPEDINRLQAAVAAAKAEQVKAEADYRRTRQLYQNDNASKADLDQSRAIRDVTREGVKSATESLRIGRRGARAEDIAAKKAAVASLAATVATASDNLSYTYLRAPFDGIITQTYVENFETVVAKQPILRLLDPSSIEFTIFVPESQIGYAPYVETITVHFDVLPGVAVKARIKEISKEASQATRTYPVTLIMEQPPEVEILPGMAGQATISAKLPKDAKEVGIAIPATAVFSAGDLGKSADELGTSYVWVVDGTAKTLSRREVDVSQLSTFGVLVKSGLEAGEWIVVKGVHSLREGQRVRIIDVEEEKQS